MDFLLRTAQAVHSASAYTAHEYSSNLFDKVKVCNIYFSVLDTVLVRKLKIQWCFFFLLFHIVPIDTTLYECTHPWCKFRSSGWQTESMTWPLVGMQPVKQLVKPVKYGIAVLFWMERTAVAPQSHQIYGQNPKHGCWQTTDVDVTVHY